jgi:hypothetical protein
MEFPLESVELLCQGKIFCVGGVGFSLIIASVVPSSKSRVQKFVILGRSFHFPFGKVLTNLTTRTNKGSAGFWRNLTKSHFRISKSSGKPDK